MNLRIRNHIFGTAAFECRNEEEAKWYSYLVKAFYKRLFNDSLFDIEKTIEIGQTEEEKIDVVVDKNKILLEFNVFLDGDAEDSDLLPLFFLNKFAKTIDCNIDVNELGQHKEYRHDEITNDIIVYNYEISTAKRYSPDIRNSTTWLFTKFNDVMFGCDEYFSICDIPVINKDGNLPKTVVIYDDAVGKNIGVFNGNDIAYSIMRIIVEYSVLYLDLQNLIVNYPRPQQPIEKTLEDVLVSEEELEKFVKQESYLRTLDWSDVETKMKLLKMITLLLNGLDDAISNSEKRQFYYSILLPEDETSTKIELDLTFDENITIHYSHIDISEDFYSYLRRYMFKSLSSKKSWTSEMKFKDNFNKMCDIDGDLYEQMNKSPLINLSNNAIIPLTTEFIMTFFDILDSEEYSLQKNSDGNFSLIEFINQTTNQRKSICDYCVNKIRKYTTGCDNCFDFELIDNSIY